MTDPLPAMNSTTTAAANTTTTVAVSDTKKYVPLIDRINRHQQTSSPSSTSMPFFSFEFFPPKTKEAAINLIARMDRLRQSGPLFCDITWHAAGNPGGDSETSSITIAGCALNYCGLDTMLHITCIGLNRRDLRQHLDRAKCLGIRNILALRGDRIDTAADDNTNNNNNNNNKEMDSIGNDSSGGQEFKFAADLVRYIRQEYGQYFTIAVAGYPSCHPESQSTDLDIKYLKAKVDAGADFIITQLFFKAEVFTDFVAKCRLEGIDVPIVAGIMPIQSYDSLEKIVKLSKLDIPQNILTDLNRLRNNDEAVRNYGIDWTVSLCRQLISTNSTPGLHFYTLNRELATTAILKRLGLWLKCMAKPLPWLPPANHRRCGEDVRPIFWSVRPKSYVYRTQSWDEFPNGRWGRSDSPAFTDLKDYYLFLDAKKPNDELRDMWGRELTGETDVWHVFWCYVSGNRNNYGKRVSMIPWNTEEELRPETRLIVTELSKLNKRGVLTINSQPNVNGVQSTDPIHGWGDSNGYVYQKAYLEFFTPKDNISALRDALKSYPLVNYQIVDTSGTNNYTNIVSNTPIAVTWGVFPGNEIIQPTVVDPISFNVWKDEAFSLWQTKWSQLYPEDSQSRQLLDYIHNNYLLVNLVDNEFPKPCCLWQLLDDMFAIRDNKKI
ncbi:methylenetetrahydrofolate reductase (NADPH)-like [Oppia nitens]|uniref:methylenetetrahydrofolate reductase (NADPH)-like n=1 Tax=Oppia nitens TaxID=1686743 RepID=UPI0023DAC473|nr:methylenetetrahydrofolate reductase (NADPH)-like [Oppia nitens]